MMVAELVSVTVSAVTSLELRRVKYWRSSELSLTYSLKVSASIPVFISSSNLSISGPVLSSVNVCTGWALVENIDWRGRLAMSLIARESILR